MKAITKYLLMMIAMMAMCVNFSSCGDDEDTPDPNEVEDFVVSYTATGGGLDNTDLSYVEDYFEDEYGRYLNGYSTNEAIYVFERFVREIRDDFSHGLSYDDAAIVGTLTLKLDMKNSKGKLVKTGYVYFTSTGSDYKI